MMESPFFSSHRSNFQPRPRYSPIVREVPVCRQAARPSSSPKVVSIPVHFVGSETSRSDYALKIQKVFRGFLVRKSVKKIAAIREEVDAVERKISRRETVESIRRDAKERLRMNETLMNLLLRLDSVRGVDSGVRDFRKAVIKKAIALQERIDAIVAGNQATSDVANEESISKSADQATETKDSGVSSGGDDDKAEDRALESEPKVSAVDKSAELCADCSNSSEIELDQTLEKEDDATGFAEYSNSEQQNRDEPMPNSTMAEEEATDETPNLVQTDEVAVEDEEKVEDSAMAENKETTVENMEGSVETISGDSVNSQSGSSANSRSSIGGDTAMKEEEEDGMEIVQKPERNDEENWGHQRRSRELLEKMMQDNEKMMGLMADLFERNYTQMQLLNSLSQRVEQLERAFVSDKLRKKKKKRAAVDCSGKCPNASKKCGNR